MPHSNEAVLRQLGDLSQAHRDDMVEVALRDSLVDVLSRDALNAAFILAADNQVDFTDVQRRLEELEKIGRPLPPGSVPGGGSPISGSRIGIQGNPIKLDQGYQGGWHFAQRNGWDSWFTITPRPAGGYFVGNPAMRLTGQHGTAHIASGTTAEFDANMNLVFDLNWGGHIGRYVCSIELSERKIHGKTFDVTNSAATYDFIGTPMPENADRPGAGSAPRMPMISLEAVFNNSDQNGYNITVSGGGFVPGEVVTIEGRATKGTMVWDWTIYATATVDVFGHFRAPTFGISKPAGTKYAFRAVSGISGYTAEVGI